MCKNMLENVQASAYSRDINGDGSPTARERKMSNFNATTATNKNDLYYATLGACVAGLLKKEIESQTDFGRDFAAAVATKNASKAATLADEFCNEVVRQYFNKKSPAWLTQRAARILTRKGA